MLAGPKPHPPPYIRHQPPGSYSLSEEVHSQGASECERDTGGGGIVPSVPGQAQGQGGTLDGDCPWFLQQGTVNLDILKKLGKHTRGGRGPLPT